MQHLAPQDRSQPPRRTELDALRVLAMSGVVAIHALAPVVRGHLGGAWLPAYLALSRAANAVCVPAFVFLTGMLVWSRPASAEGWWARRARVVFVPFIAWSAVYHLVRPAFHAAGASPEASLPASLGFLLGGAFYHLYFPPVLLAIYLLTGPARRLAAVSPALPMALALLVQALLSRLLTAVTLPVEAFLPLSRFALLLPMAAAGAWFGSAEREGRVRSATIAGAGVGGGVFIALRSLGVFPLPAEGLAASAVDLSTTLAVAALTAMLVVLLSHVRLTPHPVQRALTRLAGLAYGVYLAHPLLLTAATAAVGTTLGSAALGRPLVLGGTYAAVLAGSLCLAAALKAVPHTRWLV